jgi:hypothetical protein
MSFNPVLTRSLSSRLRAYVRSAVWAMPLLGALCTLPAGAAPAPDSIFGGWMLDRAASKLTHAPMAAEAIAIVPWGPSGWVWNHISGGRYQPEDLISGLAPPQGNAELPNRSPSTREMYFANWDGKPFQTYGRNGAQVELKRNGEGRFEAAFIVGTNAPETSALAVSADGKHLTITSGEDVRVYNRIDPAAWPSRRVAPPDPGPVSAPDCSGLWHVNEQLTHRATPALPPAYEVFGPWGNNGWIQINMGGIDAPGAELEFNTFNSGNAYEFFAADVHEQTVRQLDKNRFEVTAHRNGMPAGTMVVEFSPDCKRLTRTTAEGVDRRTGTKFYNDVRVFDRVDQ